MPFDEYYQFLTKLMLSQIVSIWEDKNTVFVKICFTQTFSRLISRIFLLKLSLKKLKTQKGEMTERPKVTHC
jgi:hypothetical protein